MTKAVHDEMRVLKTYELKYELILLIHDGNTMYKSAHILVSNR
jgi:hypothetical protein